MAAKPTGTRLAGVTHVGFQLKPTAPIERLFVLMCYCVNLWTSIFIFTIHNRVRKFTEWITPHSFFFGCTELLIEFKYFDDAFKFFQERNGNFSAGILSVVNRGVAKFKLGVLV